ncbi:MAG: hypothetical protein LBH66_00620 [Oscillospiraceae bacterium]|jgi:hypothetical protein|nr:hypothetical protein [Oscillospiraceae bacterium]
MEYRSLSFGNIKTLSARERRNLVLVESLTDPDAPAPVWDGASSEAFGMLCGRIAKARLNNRPVILSIGAHVIKRGLSRLLIAMIREGIITHLAGNGACSIHDFELAFLGGTSEYVPAAIEDGTFGMWEETGRWMNEAIQDGAKHGRGIGEALALYANARPERFPYLDDCVFYQAWRNGVPATYHIALGTDIIHQHPIVDFAAIGQASGEDFHRYCASVADMDGGVFINFGSAVIGPEVFLKALSIARNLGYPTFDVTTANFDLIDLGDYRASIGYDDPHYYYRPRKNIVNRPVSRGGMGWHFAGDHAQTLPHLYAKTRTLIADKNHASG